MKSADRIVPEVMRTAAMPERAKKTHKLMEHPILGHTSQMWEFFLQELKDIADVADLFPETQTAVELALAMRQEAVNMLGRDETVDAKIAIRLLTALYFLNIKPGADISDDAYGDILADIARIRAIIQGVHGASPGLRMVEKTDYYGWLVMFMLANAVNKAFSEMSDKSWLESNLLLDSALRVCRNIYGHIFEDVIIFINGGELGGATTASWHAHLLEKLNESYIKSLPKSGEQHLITQDDFARLQRRKLDGWLIQDFLCDVATENFLLLGAGLPKSDVPSEHLPFVARIRYLAQELASPDVDSDFRHILSKLSKRDIRNPFGTSPPFISALNFLKSGDVDYLYSSPSLQSDAKKKNNGLTLVERKALFCRHVATYSKKIAYWEKYKRGVTLSPVTEILSGALLAKLKEQGLEQKVKDSLRDSRNIPDGIEINVEIISDVRSFGGDLTTPQIRFVAAPDLWSLYGKEVFAVAEQMLNDWWGTIFNVAESYLELMKRSDATLLDRKRLISHLNALFGLSEYFSTLKWRNIPFECNPSALNYASDRHTRLEDIDQAVENYLEYFIACFARSARHSKKSGLHKKTLCPRNTTVKLSFKDGCELRETIIRPMLAYKPLMEVAAFQTLLGPIKLLAEANARFEIVELGDKKWVVQKMGGEDVLFQRDKRKHHYGIRYRRQQGERDFISGINQVMKTEIMDEAHLGKTEYLYRLYYIREYCNNSGVDFRAVSKTLAGANPDEITLQALAYAEKEIEKVRRRHQDKEHGFLHYRRVERVLRPLRAEPGFNALLDGAGLPRNKILRDHITQIIAIRELERAHLLRRDRNNRDGSGALNASDFSEDELILQARADLLQDNLDTIVFFKLAERMVGHAFADVVAAKENTPDIRPKKQRAILRDARNGSFLLADTVARLLYRCATSHEQRDEFHSAMRRGNLNYALFTNMLDYVARGLTYNGYKTKEFWEQEGAPETEGYIELIYEKQIPKDVLDDIVGQRRYYSDAVNAVSCQLGQRLKDCPEKC
ncbi:hypothetical protein CCP2SC5_410002 [Azospirillaceae bacterium]